LKHPKVDARTGQHERPGKLIVFEGLDGAGTTTQLRLLRDSLLSHGLRIEVTHEPSNGPIGAALRQTVEGRVEIDPITQSLAFAADRTDHLFNKYNGIQKSLQDGSWVLSDRYVLSGLTYQGSMGVDVDWLEQINAFVLKPDVTVFIDTPADLCISRINARGRHLELFHDLGRLHKVEQLYKKLLQKHRFLGHLVSVRGDRPIEEVRQEIHQKIFEWLEGVNWAKLAAVRE
jgi:dTMP kinase